MGPLNLGDRAPPSCNRMPINPEVRSELACSEQTCSELGLDEGGDKNSQDVGKGDTDLIMCAGFCSSQRSRWTQLLEPLHEQSPNPCLAFRTQVPSLHYYYCRNPYIEDIQGLYKGVR